MGKNEHNTPIKMEKGSPPRQEYTNIHPYPDWTTLQAYYGPGVPLQPPYFNSAVVADHISPNPHVRGTPQPLITLYGLPYPTIYSQGLVYAHPAVPIASTPLSTESLSKSSEKIKQGSTKKLKNLDGFAVPINGYAEIDAEGLAHQASQSVDNDAFSDESDGKTEAQQSLQRSNSIQHCGNVCVQASMVPEDYGQVPETPEIAKANSVQIPNGKAEPSPSCAVEGLPFEVCVQEKRHLKRERRKQANRESARRSRLRKQAEMEELMEWYECMKKENLALKSEVNQLTEDSQKVMLENAAMMEKLNNVQLEQPKQSEFKTTQQNITDELHNPSSSCCVLIKKEPDSDVLVNTNS